MMVGVNHRIDIQPMTNTHYLIRMNFTFINIKGDLKNPHRIWPVWNQKTFGFEIQCHILRPLVL